MKTCPICNKPSYSQEGVHPQCSAKQAKRAEKAAEEAAEKLDKDSDN